MPQWDMRKFEAHSRCNRVIVERLIRRDEDRGDFDRRFWQSQSVEERFAAAWDMVVEAELFRGNHAVESRLQRSVQTIQRRRC